MKCCENAVSGPLHCDSHEEKNVIFVWESGSFSNNFSIVESRMYIDKNSKHETGFNYTIIQ